MTSIAITSITTATPMLMTTNKPPAGPPRSKAGRAGAAGKTAAPPIGGRDGMNESEAAALYRLMTWLSPSFPVGAFSYSSGIEWAVEAGDIGDAGLIAGLACGVARGRIGILRRRVSGPRASGRGVTRRYGLAGYRGAGGGLRALARAPARDLGARPRVYRHCARGMELRRAGPVDCGLRRHHRLSGRGRYGQRRACNSARSRRCTHSFTR